MHAFLMASMVPELFVAALVFCRHAGRPRWRELWLLPVAFAACCGASWLRFAAIGSVGGAADVALSVVYYVFATACAGLVLARLFSLTLVSTLVVATLGYCVQHLGSDLSFVVLEPVTLTTETPVSSFYVPHILMLLATYLAVYLLVGRHFRVDADIVERRAMWVAVSVCAVLFVIVFSMVFADRQTGEVRRVCFAYDAIATLFLMLTIMLLSRVDGLRADLAAHEAIWEQRGEQYRLTQESIETINVKCHDIRKRVRALEVAGAPGGGAGVGAGAPALSEASLQRIQDSIRVYDASAQTGNDALDVVLTAKSLICAQRGIELVCLADGAALGFMADDDLFFLIENVLDNAIEAVSRVDDAEKRSVSLTVRREGDLVVIREDNYFEGTLDLAGADGLPATTKADRANHGYGLRSIRRCVDEYAGELRLRAEDGVFTLTALLPVPTAA